MEMEKSILSDITVHMKYAKFLPEKMRRENWEELVGRNKEMHIKKFPAEKERIEEAYQMVLDKKILPSMRSMQFAGKPIEVSPNRIFNCAFAPVDDFRVFGEIMFLLLGGTGVGFSVQKHHVEKLPEIRRPSCVSLSSPPQHLSPRPLRSSVASFEAPSPPLTSVPR